MLDQRMETVRAKNLERRDNKDKRKQSRLAAKEARSNAKIKKMEAFAGAYTKKRSKFTTGRIDRINARYQAKIDKVKAQAAQFTEQMSKERLAKAENSLRMRYYKMRLSLLAWRFGHKHKRLAHRVAIAAVAENVGADREKRLQLDEATAYVRWDKRVDELKRRAEVGKAAIRLEKLQKTHAAEIATITRRAEMPPAFTILSAGRDMWEITKSTYVAGFEVRSLLNKVTTHLRKLSMYYVFGAIVIIFGIATSWSNLKSDNVATIIESNLYILFIGLAMLLVIVSGAIDLSVGSMLGFAGVLSVNTYNMFDGSLAPTIITTLLFGLGYGLFQGFLIGYFKMPSFIVTLGGMLLFQGLSLLVTQGVTFIPLGNFGSDYVTWVVGSFETPGAGFHIASFLIIFICGILVVITMVFGRNKRAKYGIDTGSVVGFLIKIVLILGLFAAVGFFIADSIFGLKYYMIYLLALIVIFMFITQNTTFGRAIYAVGGNKKAAFLSGINVARTQMMVFGVIGLMTAFAGLVYSAINISATAVAGTGFELDVISSVFVGGASMTGGIGTIPGTLIGGLALGFINNGIILLNYGVEIQRIIRACILIAAVGYDVYSHRKIS